MGSLLFNVIVDEEVVDVTVAVVVVVVVVLMLVALAIVVVVAASESEVVDIDEVLTVNRADDDGDGRMRGCNEDGGTPLPP